jgi:hypothetical protein
MGRASGTPRRASEIVYLRILQSLIAILPIVVKTIAQSMGRASGTPRQF